jgi:RNA polymerase subunit RPABC4/transcription elongation factor Spt4
VRIKAHSLRPWDFYTGTLNQIRSWTVFVLERPILGAVSAVKLSSRNPWVLAPIVLLLAASGLVALAGVAASPSSAVTPGAVIHVAGSGPHGDLIVGPSNSPYVISPATTGSGTYDQAGNISVQPGGKLIVENTTLVFEEFIGTSGTAAQRLSHLYWVSVQGSAKFIGSTVTTDVNSLNVYPKLSVNASAGGTLTLIHSSFEFPGWVNIWGSTTRFQMNSSSLLPNPALGSSTIDNKTILHDAMYAPALSIGGGAHATVLQSSILGSYKNNITAWGNPGAYLENTNSVVLSGGNPATWTGFSMPTPMAASLAIAAAYPQASSADIVISYSASATGVAKSPGNSLVYAGTWDLGTLTFPATGGSTGTLTVALSSTALNAINNGGIAAFLQTTGQFGTPATLQLNLNGTTLPVDINSVAIVLNPAMSYDIDVSGASTLTAADTTMDINWNQTAGSPVPQGTPAPMPWGSNKLSLSGGSVAYLANVSTVASYTSAYLSSSAVRVDSTSTANFYRWGHIHVSAPSFGPIPGATVGAFYAYDSNQQNNATASALNDLQAADPDLYAYAQTWYAARGISAPGVTDAQGNGTLLLISTVLTEATLPDGQFLGAYHVAASVPGVPTQWGYGSVTPYPEGMSPAAADAITSLSFAGYSASVGIGSVAVLAANATVTNHTVAIGQTLTFKVPVTDTGTAAILNGSAQLYWPEPSPFPNEPLGAPASLGTLAAGKSETVSVSWVVNETVVGRVGTTQASFVVGIAYNGGSAPAGGTKLLTESVTIVPAYITIQFNPPTGSLQPGTYYSAGGSLAYAGSANALVNVTASGPSGTFLLTQASTPSGSFSADFQLPQGMGPGAYSLTVTAYYNHRTSVLVMPRAITVGGTVPSPNPLLTPIFGFPLWMIVAIVVGALGAVLGAFLALGALARGRLVECGECGELIPEKAAACPKCGAEFEPDLVRCSRCGSTIPSKSEICPECAAQLLGSAGQEARDPERQGYADFVERYRVEARKELGENYGEGAFWDWWKRQASYVSFGQWRLQQTASSRAGMSAPPPVATAAEPEPAEPEADAETAKPPRAPPRQPPAAQAARAASPAPALPRRAASAPAASPTTPAGPRVAAAAPVAQEEPEYAPAPAGAAAQPGPGMMACSSCSKEIPSDFLVCPFCGAVTR